MDYEKKIKNALNDKSVPFEVHAWLEEQFSELKESEDEQSKNWILEYLYDGLRKSDEQFKEQFKAAIAWLEKQCSQIPANYAKTCKDEQKPVDFSDLRTWKYIVDAVWTEKEGIGQYLDSPFTEEVAKKLQKRFGKIEQKPAEWSEENKKMLKDTIRFCELCGNQVSVNWLKSLRPQSHWRPSDEQMTYIQDAISKYNEFSNEYTGLVKLYNDLKKLREK